MNKLLKVFEQIAPNPKHKIAVTVEKVKDCCNKFCITINHWKRFEGINGGWREQQGNNWISFRKKEQEIKQFANFLLECSGFNYSLNDVSGNCFVSECCKNEKCSVCANAATDKLEKTIFYDNDPDETMYKVSGIKKKNSGDKTLKLIEATAPNNDLKAILEISESVRYDEFIDIDISNWEYSATPKGKWRWKEKWGYGHGSIIFDKETLKKFANILLEYSGSVYSETDNSSNDFVSGCCEGEKCSVCGNPATNKLEETIFHDDPFPTRHPLSAYVCKEHFKTIVGIFGNNAYKEPSIAENKEGSA